MFKTLALTALTLLGAVTLATSAHAQADSRFDTCMAAVDFSFNKSIQMENCALQELARLDHALNTEYTQLQTQRTVTPAQKQLLVAAERSWLTFRTNWCALDAMLSDAPSPEANRLFCMMELTQAQIKQIHNTGG